MLKEKYVRFPFSSWELPNVDAERYLHDLFNEVETRLGDRGIRADFDDVETDIDEEYLWEDLFDWYRVKPTTEYAIQSRGQAIRRNIPFDEYEGRHDDETRYHSSTHFEALAEERELLKDARSALLAGDTTAITDVLGRLLDDMGSELLPGTDFEAENWSRLLVQDNHADQEPVESRDQLVVRAVNRLCIELCRLIAEDRDLLRAIEWRQLEQIIATALEGIGFDVELTPSSKDGGKDVIATCRLRNRTLTYYLEIKHWRSGKRVNQKPLFDFLEVNIRDETDGGLFLSSSGFSPSLFVHLSELAQQEVHLGGAAKIVSLCQHFVRSRQGIWRPWRSLPDILFERTITA